jgi:TPR repeat protein
MYESGQGVEASAVEAWAWLSVAAHRGVAGAAEARDRLAMQMSAAEMAEGRRLRDSRIE